MLFRPNLKLLEIVPADVNIVAPKPIHCVPLDEYAINTLNKYPSNPAAIVLTTTLTPAMGFEKWDPNNLTILKNVLKESYTLDIFKDYYVYSGLSFYLPPLMPLQKVLCKKIAAGIYTIIPL